LSIVDNLTFQNIFVKAIFLDCIKWDQMNVETLEIRVIAEIVKNMLPIQNLLAQPARARQSPDWPAAATQN